MDAFFVHFVMFTSTLVYSVIWNHFSGFGKEALRGITCLTTFLFFLPQIYIETILIPQTNNRIKGGPLSFGGVLNFIVLWLLITSYPG